MNPFKTDLCETPVMIIPVKNNGFKFYPMNMEAVKGFLEFERAKLEEKDEQFCGAV